MRRLRRNRPNKSNVNPNDHIADIESLLGVSLEPKKEVILEGSFVKETSTRSRCSDTSNDKSTACEVTEKSEIRHAQIPRRFNVNVFPERYKHHPIICNLEATSPSKLEIKEEECIRRYSFHLPNQRLSKGAESSGEEDSWLWERTIVCNDSDTDSLILDDRFPLPPDCPRPSIIRSSEGFVQRAAFPSSSI